MLGRGNGFVQYSKSGAFVPIYFIPMQYQLYNNPIEEIFLNIPQEIFPEIKDFYMISNYGRIWHKYMHDFLSVNIDSKGYSYKPLALKNGGQRNYRVHRLVMMTFCYQEGCENLLVNHKDLNKQNNVITNLEWATYSENTIHAYENNAIDKSKMYRFKYGDNELIHSICKDLQDDILDGQQIAYKYNIPLDTVYAIKFRKAHTEISQYYNFNINSAKSRQRAASKIDFNTVEKICEYFQNNPCPVTTNMRIIHQYYTDMINTLGLIDNDTTRRTLKLIKSRTSFKNISENYSW